jgi:ABC-type sugar transport system ATPase subunit
MRLFQNLSFWNSLEIIGSAGMGNGFLLEMKGIEKTFPEVHALNNVNFSVKPGQVHALMGENGAGKSTLIKILTGIYGKDSGTILFNGKEINPRNALDAQHEGISAIYQELNLVPFLTVYENIFIGRESLTPWRTVDRGEMIRKASEVLESMGIHIDVTKSLNRYSTAIQQMVAIARAITINAKLVIMDEPTSSLDTEEVKILFAVVRKLASQGIAVIFISHRLDEIFEICEKVTVLKDGQFVGEFNVNELDQFKLVSYMIGREVRDLKRGKTGYSFGDIEELAAARNVYQGMRLNGIGVDIKKGEILGLAGLLGSGRTELAKVLFGAEIPDKGEIFFMGRKQRFRSPKDAINLGMGYCTEDRKIEGIVPHLSVKENMTLAVLPQICRFGVVSKKKQEEIVNRFIERLRIKTPSINQTIRNLSGGNQQKVLVSRWLCMNPKLVILDEPTRGIDVGAKAEIEDLIQELSRMGISVLMISSEIAELERNCDRLVVLREGVKLAELTGEDINQDKIMEIIARGRTETDEKEWA